MEIRRLKISEFNKLLESIRELWNPDHIYCRNPELLKYMVYNTPYRKDYCENDEDTTYYVIFDGEKIIGFSGLMPMEGNLFGKTVLATTGTILKVNSSYKFVGLDLLKAGFQNEPSIHIGLGINTRVKKLYNALGWYTFDDLPRWIWTSDFCKLKKVFKVPQDSNLSCLEININCKTDLKETLFFEDLEEANWDEFYNKEFAPRTIGIKRDFKFLRWRYVEYPFFEYKILTIKDNNGKYKGLLVYRIEKILDGKYNIGRILEFIYTDIDYGIKLVEKLKNLFGDILFWDFYCLSSITALALERCGFIRLDGDETKKYIPTRFQPIDFDIMNIRGIIRLNNGSKGKINLALDQQWYVTRGDADQDRPN